MGQTQSTSNRTTRISDFMIPVIGMAVMDAIGNSSSANTVQGPTTTTDANDTAAPPPDGPDQAQRQADMGPQDHREAAGDNGGSNSSPGSNGGDGASAGGATAGGDGGTSSAGGSTGDGGASAGAGGSTGAGGGSGGNGGSGELPVIGAFSDAGGILGNLDNVGGVLGTVSDVGGTLPDGSGVLGQLGDLSMTGSILQPITSLANNAIGGVSALIDDTTHQVGQPIDSLVHGLTGLGDTAGLGSAGLGTIATPLGILGQTDNTLGAAGGFAGQTLDRANLGNPLDTTLVHDVTNDVEHTPLINTGLVDNGLVDTGAIGLGGSGSGGLIQASAGLSQPTLIEADVGGNGQPTTSGHLVDADAGQSGGTQIGILDVLAQPSTGPSNQADVNIIDTGSDGPHLADAQVFNDRDLLGPINTLDSGTLTDTVPFIPSQVEHGLLMI